MNQYPLFTREPETGSTLVYAEVKKLRRLALRELKVIQKGTRAHADLCTVIDILDRLIAWLNRGSAFRHVHESQGRNFDRNGRNESLFYDIPVIDKPQARRYSQSRGNNRRSA